jgi:hypothetical protein
MPLTAHWYLLEIQEKAHLANSWIIFRGTGLLLPGIVKCSRWGFEFQALLGTATLDEKRWIMVACVALILMGGKEREITCQARRIPGVNDQVAAVN